MGKIIQSLFIIGAFLYIMYNVTNIPGIVTSAFTTQTKSNHTEHDAAVEVRRNIKPQIDNLLTHTLATLDADRVFVVEMHNGTNNTAGLPFIYGEMTYEDALDGISHIDGDYESINLSRFELPYYLEEKHLFYGTVDELRKIDKKLAARIESNDATYIAIASIYNLTTELGYFGVSYCKGSTPPEPKKIVETLTVAMQKLSILLDSKNMDKAVENK